MLPQHGVGSAADLGTRVGARLIDGVIAFVVFICVMASDGALRSIFGLGPSGTDGDGFAGVLSMVALASPVLYEVLSTKLLGATVGKRAVGITVVSATSGAPAGGWALLLRSTVFWGLWSCLLPAVLSIAAGSSDQAKRTWHDRVATTVVVRSKRSGAPAPMAVLPSPWQDHVHEAMAAKARFVSATRSATSPVVRQRLNDVKRHIDACVEECGRAAAAGSALAQAAAGVDTGRVRKRAEVAEAAARKQKDDPGAQALAEARASELASATRLHDLVGKADQRIQRLTAQLNDSVNRATELAFGSSDVADFDHVVDELRSLQEGFEVIEAVDTADVVGPPGAGDRSRPRGRWRR